MDEEAKFTANDDDRRLMRKLFGAGADVDEAVSIFRRHRLECEANIRVPECASLPRFVACTNWEHSFPGSGRDTQVRWVFDRRLWSVVVLQRLDGGAWSNARPDDVLDVTESLALANVDALYDVHGWGCVERQTLPPWAGSARKSEG